MRSTAIHYIIAYSTYMHYNTIIQCKFTILHVRSIICISIILGNFQGGGMPAREGNPRVPPVLIPDKHLNLYSTAMLIKHIYLTLTLSLSAFSRYKNLSLFDIGKCPLKLYFLVVPVLGNLGLARAVYSPMELVSRSEITVYYYNEFCQEKIFTRIISPPAVIGEHITMLIFCPFAYMDETMWPAVKAIALKVTPAHCTILPTKHH